MTNCVQPVLHRQAPISGTLFSRYENTWGGHPNLIFHLDPRLSSLQDRVKGRRYTHTRASTATYWNHTEGILATAGANIPRIELAGGRKGLLLEPASTNSCLYSRQFDNAAWVQTGTPTLTQNQVGIDGVANKAWTIEDDAATQESIKQAITVPNDSNTHNISVYFKKDTDESRFPEVYVNLVGGTTTLAHAVQLNTKTLATYERLDEGSDDFGVIDLGDYCRLWLNITNNTTGNVTLNCFIVPAATTTWGVLEAAATGSCVIDAAQVELNKTVPSSFIETTSVAVDRATESGYPLWTLDSQLQNVFAETLGFELFNNTGFETAGAGGADIFADWSEYADTGAIADELTIVNNGAHAVKLTAGSDSNATRVTQGKTLTGGKTYKYSVYTRGDGTYDGRVKLWDSTNSQMVYEASTGVTGTTYTKYEFYYTPPENAVIFLQLYAPGTNLGVAYFDDASCKEVTNAVSGGPPQGTCIVWWRPGWDVVAGASSTGLISSQDSHGSLIYFGSSGYPNSFDGANYGSVVLSYTKNTWYKLVLKFGYLSSNVAKIRVGHDSGSGIVWGTVVNYDGAYTLGSNLRLGYSLYAPMHIGDVKIYDKVLTDAEIDAGESP